MGAHSQIEQEAQNSLIHGGAEGNRTLDLRIANATLLSIFNDLERAGSAEICASLHESAPPKHKRRTATLAVMS
jgi:hypothetical protein